LPEFSSVLVVEKILKDSAKSRTLRV